MFARYPGFLKPPSGGGSVIPWNPADLSPSGAGVLTFTDDDTTATKVAGATAATVRALFAGVSSGKWYFEVVVVVTGTTTNAINIGVCELAATLLDNWTAQAGGSCVFCNGAGITSGPSFTPFNSSISFGAPGDVIGIAFEPGVSFKMNKSGGSFSTPVALAAGNFVPCINLGRDYFGSIGDVDGASLALLTAGDLISSPPPGYSVLAA